MFSSTVPNGKATWLKRGGPASTSVLIYEDDVACARALANVLRAYGYTVRIASDFQPALAALEVAPFDLPVADIVLPGGIDGAAMSRMAKLRRPSIKTILVTGYDPAEFDECADGPILRKPASHQRLLNAVRHALTG